MSEHEDDFARDDAGRFAHGNKGGPGRPKGSKGFSIKAALDPHNLLNPGKVLL